MIESLIEIRVLKVLPHSSTEISIVYVAMRGLNDAGNH